MVEKMSSVRLEEGQELKPVDSSPPQGLPRLFVDLQSWPALAFPQSLLGICLAAAHYSIRILRVELAVCT